MRVAVLGRTKMLYDTALALMKAGHEIVLIGTCPASRESETKEDDFQALAARLGVPFICKSRLALEEVRETIVDSGAQIGVSMNWLTLIPANVRALFSYGVLNAHTGDLPRYRGNACPNWAILQGERCIGLSIHEMVDELDAGDIYQKAFFPLTDKSYIGDVYAWLADAIPEAYVQTINSIQNGTAQKQPQSKLPQDALRCYPRIPSDSRIAWTECAAQIDRLVHASSEPFEGAYTYWNGSRVTIWRSYTEDFDTPVLVVPGQVVYVERATGKIGVAARDGIVVLEKITLGDDMEMRRPADVIRSLRARFTDWP